MDGRALSNSEFWSEMAAALDREAGAQGRLFSLARHSEPAHLGAVAGAHRLAAEFDPSQCAGSESTGLRLRVNFAGTLHSSA